MIHRSLLISLLTCAALGLLLSGCGSAGAIYRKANKSFEKAEFTDAIELYNQAAQKGYPKARISYQLAEAYRLSNRLALAEEHYKAAIDGNIEEAAEARFYYAQALKINGKYEEAAIEFKTYIRSGKDPNQIRLARAEEKHLATIKEIVEQEHFIKLTNCGGLNTAAAEFSPVFYQGKLLFTSSRKDAVYNTTGTGFLGIYAFTFKDQEKCSGFFEPFTDNIYADRLHESSPTFSPDGNMMVFARSNSGGKDDESEDVDLFFSVKFEGEWTEPKILDISDPDGWDACPFFSPDGKRLYFASTRKGGFGGIDLYVADVKELGKITGARNLGSRINTPGNDMFPYIANDGRLYFASDGHPGLGGLDLFVATRTGKEINIRNLGVPFNSSADDFALIFDSDSTGYFSSNRKGGKGDDDIYRFIDQTPKTKIVNYFLTILTIEEGSADSTLVPVDGAEVNVYDNNEKLLYNFLTDERGSINAQFPIAATQNLIITARKKGFFFKTENFTMAGRAIPEELLTKAITDTTLEAIVELKKIIKDEIFVLRNINYDFNKWDIRPDAAAELDKLVKILKDNPEIFIELRSHTDAVGTNRNNLVLSQKRAESATRYLIDQGIDERRIVARGYGEEELLIDTQEANEQNRRTEFKILRVLDTD
jgi:outer membrane protein OmpA-like peptidoglycan-associated protein/Tol biopolymer transport system component